MTKHMYINIGIYVVVCMLFVFPKHVEAYIDPGTGSYLYQLFLAALFSSVFFVGVFIKKIIRKFRRKKSESIKHTNEI